MKFTAIFLTVVLSGCSVSMPLPDEPEFDDCREACVELKQAKVPLCVFRKSVREGFAEVLKPIGLATESIEMPYGSCGCLTFRIEPNGSFAGIDVIATNSQESVAKFVDILENHEPIELDEKSLDCVVGRVLPVTFYESQKHEKK